MRSLPDRLDAHSYETALAGKVHVGPREAFPFEQFSVGAMESFPAARMRAQDNPLADRPTGNSP